MLLGRNNRFVQFLLQSVCVHKICRAFNSICFLSCYLQPVCLPHLLLDHQPDCLQQFHMCLLQMHRATY